MMFKKVNYKNIIGLKVFLINFVLNCWIEKRIKIIVNVIIIIIVWLLLKCLKNVGIFCKFLIVVVIVIVGVKMLLVSKVVLLIIVGIIKYLFFLWINV